MSGSIIPIYHFDLQLTDGWAVAFVNEFPVADLRAEEGRRELSVPINPYLVGTGNELRLEVHGHWGGRVPTVEAGVRRFFKGSIVAPGAGELVIAGDDWTGAQPPGPLPWTLRAGFSSPDAASFAAELLGSPPYDDREAVLAYAMQLRDLVERRRGDALVAHMQPKIEAYARAYGEPLERFAESLAVVLEEELLTGRFDLAFAATDLELEPYCGGRIWRVSRSGGGALLRTMPDSSGSSFQLAVFVGERDGGLGVVR